MLQQKKRESEEEEKLFVAKKSYIQISRKKSQFSSLKGNKQGISFPTQLHRSLGTLAQTSSRAAQCSIIGCFSAPKEDDFPPPQSKKGKYQKSNESRYAATKTETSVVLWKTKYSRNTKYVCTSFSVETTFGNGKFSKNWRARKNVCFAAFDHRGSAFRSILLNGPWFCVSFAENVIRRR